MQVEVGATFLWPVNGIVLQMFDGTTPTNKHAKWKKMAVAATASGQGQPVGQEDQPGRTSRRQQAAGKQATGAK
jgi:hypothetical protein